MDGMNHCITEHFFHPGAFVLVPNACWFRIWTCGSMCFRSGASLWVKAPWVRAQKGVQKSLTQANHIGPCISAFHRGKPSWGTKRPSATSRSRNLRQWGQKNAGSWPGVYDCRYLKIKLVNGVNRNCHSLSSGCVGIVCGTPPPPPLPTYF